MWGTKGKKEIDVEYNKIFQAWDSDAKQAKD